MRGWCPRCGARERCQHCQFCTRTAVEDHAEFCPQKIGTFPAPNDLLHCVRCHRQTDAFRFLEGEPGPDGEKRWDVVCPMCAALGEGGDGPEQPG